MKIKVVFYVCHFTNGSQDAAFAAKVVSILVAKEGLKAESRHPLAALHRLHEAVGVLLKSREDVESVNNAGRADGLPSNHTGTEKKMKKWKGFFQGCHSRSGVNDVNEGH